MSITAISFYWHNDTPSFVTWWSRLATAPDTPTCMVIHGGQLTGGAHPRNQFVPEIVSPLPCSQALVCHTLLIVYFFNELISFIGSLDKCHTSVFNALIVLCQVTNYVLCYCWCIPTSWWLFNLSTNNLLKALLEKEKMLRPSYFFSAFTGSRYNYKDLFFENILI